MKGKKIIALAAAALTLTSCVALASCGAPKSEGLYTQMNRSNHKTQTVDEVYKLEVFSDGTYAMEYDAVWAMQMVDLCYSRDLVAYGTYTDVTPADAEEGVVVYELAMPTRLTLIAMERNGINLVVDTDKWPAGDEAEEIAPGITYTLNARAETEIWENVDEFIAAYGREYTVTCDTTKGSMKVALKEGVSQIPASDAVKAAE